MNFSLKLAMMAALVLFACVRPVLAQDSVTGQIAVNPAVANTSGAVWARYPAGSIHSEAAADAALSAIDLQRAQQERIYIEQQRECYPRFFVSSCLSDAQEMNRTVSKKIKTVEIEANTYLRQKRADDRDAALAEQRAGELADAPRRAQEQQENAAENARKVAESAQRNAEADARAKSTVAAPDRVAAHGQKMRELREGAAADAQKRAENAEAYDRKVKAAHKRQKEVADNKAAKQAEREAHAAGARPGVPVAPSSAPAAPAVPATPAAPK